MITETKDWNRRMEQKAEELYESKMAGAHPKPQFSVDECGEMVLKCTETGNVLETIRRFQKQFQTGTSTIADVPACSNLTHTGHTYFNCPLLFVCTVSSDSKTAIGTF